MCLIICWWLCIENLIFLLFLLFLLYPLFLLGVLEYFYSLYLKNKINIEYFLLCSSFFSKWLDNMLLVVITVSNLEARCYFG